MTEVSTGRQRILDVAKEVFAENGYRGGSLNEVAKRSGYSRPGLLHHFPSKEAILLALLELRDERLTVYGDPVEGELLSSLLRDLPEIMADIVEDRPLVQLAHILVAEASADGHPAHAWAQTRHRWLRDRSMLAIQQSVRVGELPPDLDPLALASLLLGAVEGVEAQWLVDPTVDVVHCARTLLQVLNHLAPARSSGSQFAANRATA